MSNTQEKETNIEDIKKIIKENEDFNIVINIGEKE